MRVLICGGGVIGACTAYFLARRGVDVTVVERTEVAGAASGKAGGFLALDWCAGSPLDALARRSFTLHAELAEQVEDDWAYRRMTAYGGLVAASPSGEGDARRPEPAALAWLAAGTTITHRLGTPDTTASVNPRKFTHAMMRAAQKHGTQVRPGRVTGLARRRGGAIVTGIEVDGAVVEADAVVIAMGPWSILASEWVPLPQVFGQQSPSLVYDTGTDVPADALFLEFRDASGDELTVEVFPRADGSTHVCAFSGSAPLPLDPATSRRTRMRSSACARYASVLSPAFSPERIIAKQACFRPITRDYVPLIGRVPRVQGAYVATGHNVWGILNAPATGEAMAELIVDGEARTVDLAPFDPARLPPGRSSGCGWRVRIGATRLSRSGGNDYLRRQPLGHIHLDAAGCLHIGRVQLTLDHDAVEVAHFRHVVIGVRLMHDAAVVPYDHVAHDPLVAVFELFLRRMRHQLRDQRLRLVVRHADDGLHPHRVEIEKLPAVVRMRANQRVQRRRRHAALVVHLRELARAVLAQGTRGPLRARRSASSSRRADRRTPRAC
jgi:glycine/D-amino acid oxidase-like deaminating enzyme